MMDNLDKKAIAFLLRRGRGTWAELGRVLKLSAPAAADRVRKLEQKKFIRGYSAVVDAEALGYPLLAFVLVTLGSPRKRIAFLRAIQPMEEITECHHVAGDGDYLLKVRCRSTGDLDRILVQELKDRLGAAQTRTTIVLSTLKETTAVPLGRYNWQGTGKGGGGLKRN
jgi:Lrp/AsnC family transcriptional regulator, leucine-responsive regulatory protein